MRCEVSAKPSMDDAQLMLDPDWWNVERSAEADHLPDHLGGPLAEAPGRLGNHQNARVGRAVRLAEDAPPALHRRAAAACLDVGD